MEKQPEIRKFKFVAGLLKKILIAMFFAVLPEPGFSQQKLTVSIIRNLQVMPVNKINFSSADCAFELKIPYVKSDSVQAQIPDLPNGVNFVSLRRSEYSDENKVSGTKIELWLNFAEAKTYRLRAMRVYINSRLYYIQFAPVVISENPRNIMPRLVVTFENGKELISQRRGKTAEEAKFSVAAGKPVKFTVSLQYAVQIISYSWKVPKNAIVRELEQYDITKGTLRSSEFSEEKIPVSTFEWEPLYSGKLSLPEMKIIATSYNGTRIELKLPETLIPVTEGIKKAEKTEDGEAYFGYAFARRAVKAKPAANEKLSEEDCLKLAELRSEERHSVPFAKKFHERKNFEKKHGISDGAMEPAYFWLWGSVILLFLSVVFTVLSALTRKVPGILSFSGAMVVFLVGTIISSVFILRTYAIFKGGNVSPVPEESSAAVSSIESGKRVLVEQRAGDWVFIRFGSAGGWVKEDGIIVIDK